MFNTHEWCDEGIESHQDQFKKFLINQFPWSMKQIFKGKHVNINDVTKLPSEAKSFKKLLVMNGIKSTIFLPIYIGGNIGGFIGIDNESRLQDWDNEDISLLQISSQIIGNAYERKNFEMKLKLSEKKYRNLFNKSTHLFALINLKGEILDINDTALTYLKFSKEEIIGKHFKDIIPISDDNFDILKNNFKDLILKGSFVPIELQIHDNDFKLKWINLEATLIDLNPEQLIQVVIQDITKRKSLEQKLIDKGQQYRNILESITDAIHVINKESQIIYLNPTFSDWLKELNVSIEIIGKQVRESFPFLPEKIEKEYQSVFETGETVNDLDLIKINDNTIITETQKIPIITEGKVDQVITIIRDVTDSINAQNKIKESEEKYKALFKDSPLPILIIDLDGRILDGNPVISNQFGYKVSDLIGEDLKKLKLVPSLHLPKVLELYKKLINDEITEPIEIQIYTADRKLKWIRGQVSVVNVNKKKIIQIIIQDIEDIKQSKFKILESEIKYRDVLDNINEGYFEVDILGNIQTFNDALCRSIGYSKEELMNKHFSFLFDDENKKKIYRKYNELYELGESSILFDYEIKNKDGSRSHHESSVYLKYDPYGKINGFRGLFRDISERKKAEALRDKFEENLEREVKIRTNKLKEVLLQQKLYLDQILKASNFKTDFLSTMSHELRTPLNAIIGFTDLLLEGYYGELNKDQRDFIEDIEESSNHLLDMITNILDISKIESGEISLKIDKVRLAVIVNNVISTLQPLYIKKNLLVNIKGLKDEIIINADKLKLKQIIYNLLSNAIKFTEKGTITIEFKEKFDNWEFKIRDTGIGIAKEDYDIIFKDFIRVNSPYVNSIPGSGLGLALTKRLVELHGGNISFTSKLGKGTTFKFEIPNKIKNRKVNYGLEGFLKLL